jgi:hypothetical protein
VSEFAPGADHRLGVWADGETLRLYADGACWRRDGTYSDGMFGVFIALSRGGFGKESTK